MKDERIKKAMATIQRNRIQALGRQRITTQEYQYSTDYKRSRIEAVPKRNYSDAEIARVLEKTKVK